MKVSEIERKVYAVVSSIMGRKPSYPIVKYAVAATLEELEKAGHIFLNEEKSIG